MSIRVLIVDDSAIVRKTISKELENDSEIEVVGTAEDPYVARDKIVELKPDIITLDISMPKMDGITFLKKLMAHKPIPVVVISSLSEKGSKVAFDALAAGAVEVLCKPKGSYNVNDIKGIIPATIKAAAKAKLNIKYNTIKKAKIAPKINLNFDKVLLIGASTGGAKAIENIICSLPDEFIPIVITQHMPPGFTKSFANRINELSKLNVKEAEDNDPILKSHVYIAPGGKHCLIQKDGANFKIAIKDGPAVMQHKPSVDVLFKSGVSSLKDKAVAVILTGMGSDGANGLKDLHDAGAYTIAQDESTSVVFGMPKVAIELGAAKSVEKLCDIPNKLISILKK